MNKLLVLLFCLACGSFTMTACSDFRERLHGYPKEDIVVDKEKASSNELADALNRISRMSVIGDDWEFEDENDKCNLTVVEGDTERVRNISLLNSEFEIKMDKGDGKYFAIIKNNKNPVLDNEGNELRLLDTDSYHSLSIAEGYLIALAEKCMEGKGR